MHHSSKSVHDCKKISVVCTEFAANVQKVITIIIIIIMNDIGIGKKKQRYIIKNMINIAIRATYYIFCCRNRNWDSPD